MDQFEFVRVDDGRSRERVWVRTPFPVTQNVWANFVFRLLDVDRANEHGVSISKKTVYLNRWENEPVDEIAQGQYGSGRETFKHAYLPHCERQGLNVHDWGLIHVPVSRDFYLDQIEAELDESPKTHSALLKRLNSIQQRTVGQIFERFFEEMAKMPNEVEVLRQNLIERLKSPGILPSQVGHYKQTENYRLGEFPVFPAYIKDNNHLVSQTALDFIRNLDGVLIRETRSDRGIAIGTVRNIYRTMHGMYSHLMADEARKKNSVYNMNAAIDGVPLARSGRGLFDDEPRVRFDL